VRRAADVRSAFGLAAALWVLTGCGFLGAGDRGANKPDAFVLRGYVSVGGAAAGRPGSACEPPGSIDDIHAGGAVRVADPDGHTLGSGELSAGVLALAGDEARCNFAFEIPGVPGGVDRYVIGVGNRTPVAFAARDLRRDKPAVLRIP
jgi:hypothetical protein